MRMFSGCLLTLLMITLVAGKEDTPANLVAGKQVPADANLHKGDRLVAVYEKKNYVVEIRDVKANKKVSIVWVSTGEVTDDVDQTELYYAGDATPTRKARKSPLPDRYQAFDKNKDGQISLSEWDRSKYAEFRKLDRNRDGFLTPQELAATVITVASAPAGTAPAKEGEPGNSKAAEELENPGTLVEYQDQIKMSYTFKVTGKVGGPVWGSGPYAVESDLATAAVHAGLLKDGAAGVVKVTILEPANRFTTSSANGVTSVERQEAGPAFSMEAVKKSE